MEPLKLPYYYNLDDTEPYQIQGSLDEISGGEPDGPYILLHHVIVREGTSAWNTYRYDIMGELPAEYDRDTLHSPYGTDSIFAEYAVLYRIANNTAVLTASDNIAALEEFQQGNLYVREGRFPQTGEAGVCIISGGMAESLMVGVGDSISLEILNSDPGERYMVSATGDQRSLEIVGITNPSFDYPDRLWVSDAESGFPAPLFGYSLGMAVLVLFAFLFVGRQRETVGALAMTLLYPGGAVWLAGAGFLVCYLAGCALSVLAAGRSNLMLLLSERE